MSARTQMGLTLVELVITISLAGIIGVPVGIILSRQLDSALRARDYAVAMSLARAAMEQVDSASDLPAFCNLNSTVPAPVSGYPAYTVERVVACQTTGSTCNCGCSGACGTVAGAASARNDIKRIEIRLTKSGSGERLATLVTYRTKYVLFGP